jgi:hypothetical protein
LCYHLAIILGHVITSGSAQHHLMADADTRRPSSTCKQQRVEIQIMPKHLHSVFDIPTQYGEKHDIFRYGISRASCTFNSFFAFTSDFFPINSGYTTSRGYTQDYSGRCTQQAPAAHPISDYSTFNPDYSHPGYPFIAGLCIYKASHTKRYVNFYPLLRGDTNSCTQRDLTGQRTQKTSLHPSLRTTNPPPCENPQPTRTSRPLSQTQYLLSW